MKKLKILKLVLFAFTVLLLPRALKAQDDKAKMLQDSKDAKAAFLKTDPSMSNMFKSSYGYVIFPHVGKGAVVVGGGGGNGIVYEKGKDIGSAKMAQVSVGAQVGGQAYREIIFFENKAALDRFKENKFEFSGEVSAVAVKSGASASAKYREGVAVFTDAISGLMAEASVGGQKFSYKSF